MINTVTKGQKKYIPYVQENKRLPPCDDVLSYSPVTNSVDEACCSTLSESGKLLAQTGG